MPVKIGTLLSSIAQKFGVPTDTPDFIDLLSTNLEVPDSIAGAFTSDLLTFEAARNSPKLKAHYYATSLNEVDRRLQSGMAELAFSDTMRTDVLAASSTFDRIDLYNNKIKELIAQREGTKGQERTQLTEQINTVRSELAQKQQEYIQQSQQMQQQHNAEMMDVLLSGKIASRRLDTAKFPVEVMQGIARNFVDQALQQRGAKPVYANKNLALKQATAPELDYYENNKAYNIDAFIDEVLAANKLLVVNDLVPPAPQNPGSTGNSQQTNPRYQPQSTTTQPPAPQPLNGMLSKLDRLTANLQQVEGNRTV